VRSEIPILVIDDDEVDRRSMWRAFDKLDMLGQVEFANGGAEGIDHLLQKLLSRQLDRPYLIVLDINMPCMNGFEFLEMIRGDSKLQNSCVFIMTTSLDATDIGRAYDFDVAGYLIKDCASGSVIQAELMLDRYTEIAA
jgi:CheY-like chemotaxis protein